MHDAVQRAANPPNPILTLTSEDCVQIIGSSLRRLADPSVHVSTPSMVLGDNNEDTMTVTHEATPESEAAPKEPKPKRTKKAEKPSSAAEPTTDEQPATEPTKPAKPEKRGKAKPAAWKRPTKGPMGNMTLKELCDHYLAHLKEKKSAGTAVSYEMELARAVEFLGADTPIGTITPDDVRRFNESKLVMRKKDGSAKALPSFLKTRRVLRLALVWAASDRRWLDAAPIPQDDEAK